MPAGRSERRSLPRQQCAFAAYMFAATYPEANARRSCCTRPPRTGAGPKRRRGSGRTSSSTRTSPTSAPWWHCCVLGGGWSAGVTHLWRTITPTSSGGGRSAFCPSLPEARGDGSTKYTRTDIRGILASIHVPVLVLIRRDHARAVVGAVPHAFSPSAIAGARHVELEGRDLSLWVGDQASVLARDRHVPCRGQA